MTRSRRHGLVALWLATALLATSGTWAVTSGADSDEAAAAVESSDEPTAEPTPFPAFDPAGVSIRTDLFADGFDAPVYLADDGTGSACVYVVERGGVIRIVSAAGEAAFKPFLDLGDKVALSGLEQGLHSIAFHPKFKKNGRVFVHYNSAAQNGATVIEEYRGRPCKPANQKPVKTLLTIDQPYPNNNGGWIGFGRDGMLYIPLGDGGGTSPGDPDGIGQDKGTRLSKVLRINVNKGNLYVVPRDNPYPPKKTKGFPPETWARGLRDPRRSSFDRKTGDLWIGDVGQDRFEEVDRIPKGVSNLNFGWSDMEGDRCHNLPDCDPTLYEPPVYFYDQVPPHRAITGGYVYRGSALPELDGVYLFSDYASGFIWGLDADAVAAGETAVAHQLLDAPQGFVSFGEDDAGEVYVVSLDGGIYRIGAEDA